MDTVFKVFYEGIKIISKIFEIWGFGEGRFDYDFNRDIPTLQEKLNDIYEQFKND